MAFKSPNAGQTSLTLQHSTSPSSGYKPNLGANRDGYPTGGIPIRHAAKKGCTGRAKALAKTFKKMAKKRKK